ncbi:hypothetical protein IMZ48_37640 [Candidatus Bathyarchaeota archaeon]|nr:hypothetical protein [Candidatus Bathyarchaeota archaeon]
MATFTTTQLAPDVPDTLFHTLLTVVDFHTDPSGGTRSTWVLGTHTTLPAAMAFAKNSLASLGYDKSDFATYEEAPTGGTPLPDGTEQKDWTHGDGYIVWAKAAAGQVFEINIDAKPNYAGYPAGKNSTPVLPDGMDHLHYVLQTHIDYNKDRSGAAQETGVEGAYAKRSDAMIAAKGLLLKREFDEYDEREEGDAKGAWEFGEDVVVHAVKGSGENYDVSVRTVPGAHKMHGRRMASV